MKIINMVKNWVPIPIKQNMKSIYVHFVMKKEWRKGVLSNTVLFESFDGRQYSDNPKRISEVLHEIYPEYNQVWAMKFPISKKIEIPDYVSIVDRHSIVFYKVLASCFCYVRNTHFENDIFKNGQKQFFIQTWHGDIGFKKVLYDANPKWRKKGKVLDEKIVDLCIAGSDYGIQQYRSAFGYTGEIMNIGTPRNDRLVNINDHDIYQIKEKIGIDSDCKVLIFAPTFRDHSNDKLNVKVDLHQVLDTLEKNGEKWICILRAHANSAGLEIEADERFKDVTDYPDMADLLLISDLLITDYSSCAGDFIRKNKGAIFAVFDKEEYQEKCREIPFDIEKAGFLTAYTQNELINILKNNNDIDYERNCKKIKKHFNVKESGKTAEMICDRIHAFYLSIKQRNWRN